ncbi:MAG: DNA translocase FtsK 4TM domain-containing protein [Bacteroides sp.]|nr:MAG: DNA translocase FtsK 4TM domain-containing protein [Bacteroides sp.]
MMIKKILNSILIIIALFILMSLISYTFNWQYDQFIIYDKSLIDILAIYKIDKNSNLIIHNHMGYIGSLISHIMIYKSIGIAAFSIPISLLFIGLLLFFDQMSIYIYKLIIINISIITIFPVFFTKIFSCFNCKNDLMNYAGGQYGFIINNYINLLFGQIGSFLLIIVFILMYIIIFKFSIIQKNKHNIIQLDDFFFIKKNKQIILNIICKENILYKNIHYNIGFTYVLYKIQTRKIISHDEIANIEKQLYINIINSTINIYRYEQNNIFIEISKLYPEYYFYRFISQYPILNNENVNLPITLGITILNKKVILDLFNIKNILIIDNFSNEKYSLIKTIIFFLIKEYKLSKKISIHLVGSQNDNINNIMLNIFFAKRKDIINNKIINDENDLNEYYNDLHKEIIRRKEIFDYHKFDNIKEYNKIYNNIPLIIIFMYDNIKWDISYKDKISKIIKQSNQYGIHLIIIGSIKIMESYYKMFNKNFGARLYLFNKENPYNKINIKGELLLNIDNNNIKIQYPILTNHDLETK